MGTSVLTQPARIDAVRAANRSSRSRLGWRAFYLLLPSALFLALFVYWPVVQVSLASVRIAAFGKAASWGLGNYQRLFADARFLRAVGNNLTYAAGTVVPSLALALLFALGLQGTGRLTALLRTGFVLPMFVPLVAAASLFSFLFLPGAGLIDQHLGWAGLAATNWLGDPDLAMGSIIAITIWKNTGYYMMFFLAGLAGVPKDLLEAAKLDGAGPFRRFFHVTLPMLGPTIGFVAVIATLNGLTQVDHILLLTQGGPSDATNVLLYYIYEQAQQNNDLGLAAAATVISVAALLALSTVSLRTVERELHYES